MNQILELLAKYNRREQTMLLLVAAAVVLYLLWVLVLAPLQSAQVQQMKNNIATSAALGRVEILAAKIELSRKNKKQSGQSSRGNISQLIDSSLQARGLSMSGFQPSTQGEVRVRLDSVNYTALIQWLYDIEYQHNMVIRDMTLAASSNPGFVTVNIRLRKN